MSEEPNMNTPKKNVSQDVVEAINLLAQGKRNMMCGEVAHAANQLQEACRILDKEYGGGAVECADAYFWYGKALLEVSRLEGGVLGDAVPGGDSEASSQSSKDDDDDDDEEEEDNVAADAGSSVNEGTDEESALSEDIENEEADDGTETEKSKMKEKTGEEAAGTDGKDGATGRLAEAVENCKDEDASVGDDVSNLQLAWEMMECAKVIYTKHDSPDMKLKLADTYSKLGEIGMETEQYDQAISDLSKCLEIQQQLLAADDRRLAETHYQLGLVCTFDKQYDEAVLHYRGAIDVMKSKIAHLTRVASGELPPDAGVEIDGFDTPQQLALKEIEDLESILPDLFAKIEDVEDERRNADQVSRLLKESVPQTGGAVAGCSSSSSSKFMSPASSNGTSSSFSDPSFSATESVTSSLTSTAFQSSSSVSATGQINDISHLVRKKRKPEETAADADPSKKPKIPGSTAVVDVVAKKADNGQDEIPKVVVKSSLLSEAKVDSEAQVTSNV